MTTIKIKGAIIPNDYKSVYEWLGLDATSPRDVEESLSDAKDNVTVEINSGGGSVFAGSEIYTMLKSFDKKVTVKITGVAASAASVIAMAGDVVKMSPTAQLMIHNATTSTNGDFRDMQHTADFLQKINKSIANAYQAKTGKTEKELFGLMNKESWFTAKEAKKHGFIDEVMFDDQLQATASVSFLPDDVINKIKNKLVEEKNLKAKVLVKELELLKLKGDVN